MAKKQRDPRIPIPGYMVTEIKRMRAQGLSWNALAKEARKTWPESWAGLDQEQAIRRCRNAVMRKDEERLPTPEEMTRAQQANGAAELPEQPISKTTVCDQAYLRSLLTAGADLEKIAEDMKVSRRIAEAMVEDARDAGYNVQERGGLYKLSRIAPPAVNRVKESWAGEKIVRFGLISDTHINSKWTQLTFLHHLYDIFAREGIATVYHAGDLDDGEKMHPGHEYEIYHHGADEHIREIVRVYPRREGIQTKFITGNHDSSYIKQIGLNIGVPVAAARADMSYLGIDSAVINLTDRCTLELSHPGDGSSYAISYKTQKRIDAMSGGEKPNLLAVGHYHKSEMLPMYRNVHAFQAATVCAQTPWMRGKGLAAHVGGWLIEVHVEEDGSVQEIIPRFFPLYKTILDDYKNFQ